MKEYIALSKNEYNKLFKRANLNEKRIKRAAYDYYLKHGLAELTVYVQVNATTSKAIIRGSSIVFRNDSDVRFISMQADIKRKLKEIIQYGVNIEVNKTVVGMKKEYNQLEKKYKALCRYNLITRILLVAGWVAFFVCLFLRHCPKFCVNGNRIQL